MKYDSWLLSNWKSETIISCWHIFTETWLPNNILDQAVAVNRWTMFCHPGEPYQSWGIYINSIITHQQMCWLRDDHKDIESFPNQMALMNGAVRTRINKNVFQQKSWYQEGKVETSGETEERPQHQQNQRLLASETPSQATRAKRSPLCARPCCQKSLKAYFDLLNKELAV